VSKHTNLQCVVSLGANLPSAMGMPAETLLLAADRLSEMSTGPLLRSSLYRTAPLGCPPDTPDFINAVVSLELPQNAQAADFLHDLLRLEREFGRSRNQISRVLDLDLISFGDQQYCTPQLTVPHPRAHLRRFVLQPLVEICPDLVLAGFSKSARELLRELDDNSSVKQIK